MTARGKRIALGAIAIPCIATVAAYFLLIRGHSGTAAGPAPSDKPRGVRVQVVRPEKGGVERTVTRPCSIHSYQYANLYAKVTGFLEHQSPEMDIGTQVTKGQVLANLNAPEKLADVERAKADLAKAQAAVKVAEARVEETQSGLKRAQASLRLTRLEYNRYSTLAKQNAINQELVDEKYQSLQVAEANRFQAEKATLTAKAELTNAQASVKVAEASLSYARDILAYTKITSPYDGVITARNYHNGDLIKADDVSRPPIYSVARTDLMRVIMWVPDPFVRLTHRGVRAEIRVDSLDGEVYHGKVARTARSEEYTSRTMRTEVDLPNKDDQLVNGMYGTMTLFLGKTTRGLTVPSGALVGEEKNGKRRIFVVRDGKARELTVGIVRDDGIRAEVEGLDPGDEVIVQHGAGLADGVPVEVVPEGLAAQGAHGR